MFLIAELKDQNSQTVALVTVPPKEFKTGSRGYFGTTKAEIDGKRYQVQIQIVEIGSKKKSDEEEK